MFRLDAKLTGSVLSALFLGGMLSGCATSADSTLPPTGGDGGTGAKATGASGGAPLGGAPAAGTSSSGGVLQTGGVTSAGGAPATSGGTSMATGGVKTGGTTALSGGTTAASGGTKSGGTTALSGGTTAASGGTKSGGTTAVSGGTTAASGGTAAATGGTVAAGGSTLCTGSAAWGVAATGFVTSGSWSGYAYTAKSGTGTTITPDTFSDAGASTSLCASGSVGAMSDYSGTAMIGYNIAQLQGTSTLGGCTLAATSSLSYSITNTGKSAIRLQIQASDGETVAAHRWCYTVASATTGGTLTGSVPLSSFNTQCWEGGTGTAFDGTVQIAAALVLVPGGNAAAVPFDFCITALGPA